MLNVSDLLSGKEKLCSAKNTLKKKQLIFIVNTPILWLFKVLLTKEGFKVMWYFCNYIYVFLLHHGMFLGDLFYKVKLTGPKL